MLTEEQLVRAQELFTAAVSYNAALHAAFVSTDDMVSVNLAYNGKVEQVSVPTYHYLLRMVEKLSKQVAQMQISDDGSDVIQLLSKADNLTLLYLQKRQYYVQPPLNAELVKYDYETRPTAYSSADRTTLFVSLSGCKLPMDAQFCIAQLDDEAPMCLPIIFKTSTFDKIANVLQVSGTGETTSYLIDSNDFKEGDTVQCNSNLYIVTAVAGNTIQLSCEQPSVIKTIDAGDSIYSVTDASEAYLEVPVCKVHEKLTLQVQYMSLLSAKATYSLGDMANAIHQTERVALKDMLSGKTKEETIAVLNKAVRTLDTAKLSEILANSVPTVSKTTIRQTNTHQYIHSAVETMVKTNAILVQAKEDMERLEELIATTTQNIINSGGNVENDETLLTYNDQLASVKNRYQSAQASLASMNISAQAVRPEYEATVYLEPNDSAGLPIVQYVARYQPLSLTVQDVKNNWTYVYGNKRTINENGELAHPIDNYDILNSIALPIHAYEQIAVQVAAVLQYGQPIINVQTGWTDTMFLTIPDSLLKEVSVDEMFKNAYEAKLYTNVQQAMEAAGVFRHINTNVTYAHRAQDIQYDNEDTVYTKLQAMVKDIGILQSASQSAALNIYIRYNGQTYPVSNGSSLDLQVNGSYYDKIFGNKTGAELQEALGSVFEDMFEILIVNNTNETVYLHTIIPGSASIELQESTWGNYADIPIIVPEQKLVIGTSVHQYNRIYRPTEAMALYRQISNAAGNRVLVKRDAAVFNPVRQSINTQLLNGGYDLTKLIDQSSFAGQRAVICSAGKNAGTNAELGIQGNVLRDYPGIGIHNGFPLFYGAVNIDGSIRSDITSISDYMASLDIDALPSGNIFNYAKYILGAKRLGLEFPWVNNFAVDGNYDAGGAGQLADAYTQYALFASAIDAAGYQGYAISRFDPSVHKYTSGRASRGAFLFINAVNGLGDIQLPAYGTSNAISIQPNTGTDDAGLVVQCKFQTRMCDRVGLTDTASIVSDVSITDPETGVSNTYLIPAKTGENFTYKKTIALAIKTGLQTIQFDVTISQSWLA